MYLNDVEEGGETFFPKLNLSVHPRKGMAVYFEYFYQDQSLNELTLHGGAPVTKGEKWIATQWVRRGTYKCVYVTFCSSMHKENKTFIK